MKLLKFRKNTRIFYGLLSCLFFVSIYGCNSNDKHDHPDLVTGEQLFEYHCSGCHKNTGHGNFLKGIPANKNTDLSSAQIVHKINLDAEEGSKMPTFPAMSETETAKIASYLKQMSL